MFHLLTGAHSHELCGTRCMGLMHNRFLIAGNDFTKWWSRVVQSLHVHIAQGNLLGDHAHVMVDLEVQHSRLRQHKA
jgi:hypothetical protein